jgi:hypothetical protein
MVSLTDGQIRVRVGRGDGERTIEAENIEVIQAGPGSPCLRRSSW